MLDGPPPDGDDADELRNESSNIKYNYIQKEMEQN